MAVGNPLNGLKIGQGISSNSFFLRNCSEIELLHKGADIDFPITGPGVPSGQEFCSSNLQPLLTLLQVVAFDSRLSFSAA